ncbi:hypothetical protein [Paenibacillus camelliae]|uniref:hypothetical protein n=1 Tax=Paenibacillus camelliae TaxID=512410 RepID=UPI00203C3283|nr:hypothetical protein [Paenibacillus camelliae]MCM3635004.1 hypothetical protein [Paenibacillus camelliae]
MNSSPHTQAYAYRRNPAQSVHASTFHPQQFGHGHGHVGTITQARPPQGHYSTSASISPFQAAQSNAVAVQEVETNTEKEKKPSSGFSLASLTKYANIDELKGLVDRFGGLEGILSTVTTVQKVVSTVGQIAPMVKVVTGVLGKNKAGAAPPTEASIPARRRVRTTTKPRSTRSNRSAPPRRNGQGRSNSTRRSSTPLMKRPPSR